MLVFTVSCAVVLWLLWRVIWRHWGRETFVDPRGLAVFISGCDTGIGHRLAIYFSDIGCEVFAGCLNPKTASSTLSDSICIVQLDVTDNESVRKAVETVRANLEKSGKHLSALINNAGICVFGQFEWQTWNQCEKQVQVNVLGTMRLTKAFIPLIRTAKGRIITVSSINGQIAYPGLSVYSATKFALEGWMDSMRLEMNNQYGIKIITIKPGDYARLTSIMSRHQQNAEDMWNDMSLEEKERCGDFFHKYQKKTLENYGLTSPSSFEGCHLLKDLREAVLSKDPKVKYISAPISHRLVYFFLTLLPTCLTDYLLGKITDMIYNS